MTITVQTPHVLSHLDALEAEAISIIREVAAECERPALLFSGGKDSAVLLHLAVKAFAPGSLPFPVLHVDTGHNFPEVIEYRDRHLAQLGETLIVASVEESIRTGRAVEDPGPDASRNRLQSVTLLDAIEEHRFDVLFGGGRRDEDKARAKERLLSHRNAFGQWEPRKQRPEPWGMLNTRLKLGEHLRAFPISNWTELDVWNYIAREAIDLPTIYYAHRRPVFERHGMLFSAHGPLAARPDEPIFEEQVRYRTVGDMTCTGALRSSADTIEAVIYENRTSEVTERGASRADDQFSETAMEDRKREGYF
ncbi:MAG: sulfate adenylyltransferase subunit CysD [Acidimicrobiia bacterium]